MAEDNGIISEESSSLQLIDDNKTYFKFFRFVGLFSLSCKNGIYKVDEKVCIISRLLWFLWNASGMAIIAYIVTKNLNQNTTSSDYITINDNCHWCIRNKSDCHVPMNATTNFNEEMGDVNIFLLGSIGVLLFILVDPVQTIILKRNLNFLPKILEEIKYLENIKLGNQSNESSGRFAVSHIGGFKNNGFTESPYTNDICESNSSGTTQLQISDLNGKDYQRNKTKTSKCYKILLFSILGLSVSIFIASFGVGFYCAVRPKLYEHPHDIANEYKFFGSLFYLVFPVLTTWFCVFFIGYQRKMYKSINALPDDQFENEESIKIIAEYIETMQIISEKLGDRIYKFTFGINFTLFIIIATLSTYEMIQGIGETRHNSLIPEFGDIIYIFPIAVCVFHMFISCQRSSTLVTGQHSKLLYKLKGIMKSLLVDKTNNEKMVKKVELLYKNIKDFNPSPEVFGGFKLNYSLFTGMCIFIFSYAKMFYKFW